MKLKTIFKWSVRIILIALLLAFITLFVAYWRSSNDCGQVATTGQSMKAIVYCDYGSPDALKVEEVPKPLPADDELLVKVHAASVNPLDWHYLQGTPYLMRMETGLRKPKSRKFGVDFAGTVEAIGKNVTKFKPGDEVFGGRDGALAEYLCVGENRSVTPKPSGITFEQAASIPIAGVTALQALRDKAEVKPGQSVLINGASGGVGTFAVQIAKSLGANVTAVCSTKNVELVRSLGADQVIDYTKEDFAKGGKQYDVIIDNVPNHSLSECRQLLPSNGKYIIIGGGGPKDSPWIGPFGRILQALVMKPFISQKMGMMLAELKATDLAAVADLMQSGKVKAVIDRKYNLSEVPAAVRYLEEGHARGKIVIAIE